MENCRRLLFIKNIVSNISLNNSTLTGVTNVYIHRGEFRSVLKKCDVDISWSVSRIKRVVYQTFNDTCK